MCIGADKSERSGINCCPSLLQWSFYHLVNPREMTDVFRQHRVGELGLSLFDMWIGQNLRPNKPQVPYFYGIFSPSRFFPGQVLADWCASQQASQQASKGSSSKMLQIACSMEGKWKDRCRGWKTEQIRKKKPGQGKTSRARFGTQSAGSVLFWSPSNFWGTKFWPIPLWRFPKNEDPQNHPVCWLYGKTNGLGYPYCRKPRKPPDAGRIRMRNVYPADWYMFTMPSQHSTAVKEPPGTTWNHHLGW